MVQVTIDRRKTETKKCERRDINLKSFVKIRERESREKRNEDTVKWEVGVAFTGF